MQETVFSWRFAENNYPVCFCTPVYPNSPVIVNWLEIHQELGRTFRVEINVQVNQHVTANGLEALRQKIRRTNEKESAIVFLSKNLKAFSAGHLNRHDESKPETICLDFRLERGEEFCKAAIKFVARFLKLCSVKNNFVELLCAFTVVQHTWVCTNPKMGKFGWTHFQDIMKGVIRKQYHE